MIKEMKNKKGISPVIASVLMILMVVVLAGMVFLWARGFISEQVEKFGQPIENQCDSVDFNVYWDRTKNNLEVSNTGNINIRHLDVKLVLKGRTEFQKFPFSVPVSESDKRSVTFKVDGKSPDEVFVYPALIGNVVGENTNKVFTCLDNGIKIWPRD